MLINFFKRSWTALLFLMFFSLVTLWLSLNEIGVYIIVIMGLAVVTSWFVATVLDTAGGRFHRQTSSDNAADRREKHKVTHFAARCIFAVLVVTAVFQITGTELNSPKGWADVGAILGTVALSFLDVFFGL